MTVVLTIDINVFIAVSRVLGRIPILRLLAPARLHHLRVLLSRLVYELYPSPPCFHLTCGTLDTDLLLWFKYQHVPNAVGSTVFVHVVALPGGFHGVSVRLEIDVALGYTVGEKIGLAKCVYVQAIRATINALHGPWSCPSSSQHCNLASRSD